MFTFGPDHLCRHFHTVQFDYYENLRLAWVRLWHKSPRRTGLLYVEMQQTLVERHNLPFRIDIPGKWVDAGCMQDALAWVSRLVPVMRIRRFPAMSKGIAAGQPPHLSASAEATNLHNTIQGSDEKVWEVG